VALEEAEHAALQRALEAEDVVGGEMVASWKVMLPSSPSEKTPSRTTTWTLLQPTRGDMRGGRSVTTAPSAHHWTS
jgi:hypothetical protein